MVLKEARRLLKKEGVYIIQDCHNPKNILLRTLLRAFIVLVEVEAQSFIKTEWKNVLQKYFKGVKQKLCFGGTVQILAATK